MMRSNPHIGKGKGGRNENFCLLEIKIGLFESVQLDFPGNVCE